MRNFLVVISVPAIAVHAKSMMQATCYTKYVKGVVSGSSLAIINATVAMSAKILVVAHLVGFLVMLNANIRNANPCAGSLVPRALNVAGSLVLI